MINGKKIILKKRPSSVGALLRAFKENKHKIRAGKKIEDIEAEWKNINLKNARIKKFNKICDLEKADSVSILYPFTMVYPINLCLISHREVPVPMLKMLTTRNTTIIYNDISPDDNFSLTSKTSGQRFLKNGMEFFMDSVMYSKEKKVWENRSTIFIPGKIKHNEKIHEPFKLEQPEESSIVNQWFLPAKNGFRFARIMGDSNGIHYSKRYAKKLGFKRDFAQPLLVASKCIEKIPELPGKTPLKLDLFFKGQVYYNSEITLKNESGDNSRRFDLYCEGNDRPCICGKLERL